MKKTLIFLLLFMSSFSLFADMYTPPFPLIINPIFGGRSGNGDEGGEGDDEEGKGHRAPARPAYCSIDFDAAEVNIPGYDCADIETFEICDAESHVCVYGTDDCAEFVGELTQIHDTVYVIFHFDGFTLSGYFAR